MTDMADIRRKLLIVLLLLSSLFLAGVGGYRLIEGWPVFDAVYMTVITLATVGYGEVHPLSPEGRAFTMFLIVFGMGTFVYGVSTITAFIIEGELGGYLRRKKVKSRIDALEGHCIVCGSGDIARYVVQEMHKTKQAFVVVDENIEGLNRLAQCIGEGMLSVKGNPAEDRVLLEAGVARARGLVSACETDKDNLIVVMTARSLNQNIRIVTRAIDECCAPKFSRAGADAVVSAESIGGMRMASELIRPAVVSFLDRMLRGTDNALRVEEVHVPHRSSLIGKSLREADIADRTGLAVIAVKNAKTDEYRHVPRSSHVIAPDDILIVIGSPEQIESLKSL